jgi:RNA recognition motif-containing protein
MPPAAAPASVPPPRAGGAFNATSDEAAEHAKNSIKENRVYVGNLSYDVKYKDLEQFMTDGA